MYKIGIKNDHGDCCLLVEIMGNSFENAVTEAMKKYPRQIKHINRKELTYKNYKLIDVSHLKFNSGHILKI